MQIVQAQSLYDQFGKSFDAYFLLIFEYADNFW